MSRRYINSSRLDQLADRLSPKERAILLTLQQVRLASASQLGRLHFVGKTSRYRTMVLKRLADRGLVARLDRTVGSHRAGSAGYLYAMSTAGQRLIDRTSDGPLRRVTTPGTLFVAHTLAVTELVVRLREAERRGGFEILDFETEPQCWRSHPGPGGATVTCKPDAYLRLGIGAYEDSWFLEIDLASEGPTTLTRKLDAYRRYWASGLEQARRGVFPRVLWLVPNLRRHQVVVDACGRQPAESWQLHQLTLYDDAVGLITGGES